MVGWWFSLYAVLKVYFNNIILDSSMVEHSAVNRGVVGSSPTRGVGKSPQTLVFVGFCISEDRREEILAGNILLT